MTTKEQDQKKVETERDRMFMKDKHGLPMNETVKAKNPQKYGVLAQH